jgi:hypothetical protein
MEIDLEQSSLDNPGLLADRIRVAFQLVELAVEDQLERAAEPSAPRREPLLEDPLRPGDPVYDRLHPPAPEPARRPPPPVQQSPSVVNGDDLPVTAAQF